MNRGEIYTARLDPVEGSEQAGARPVVIVSRGILAERAAHVVAIPITTFRGRRLAPSHVLLPSGSGGLSVESVALAEQVRVLSKSRLGRRWGQLAPPEMSRIDSALRHALDLD